MTISIRNQDGSDRSLTSDEIAEFQAVFGITPAPSTVPPSISTLPAINAAVAGALVSWSAGTATGVPAPTISYALRKNGVVVATQSGVYSSTLNNDVLTVDMIANNGVSPEATGTSAPVAVSAPQAAPVITANATLAANVAGSPVTWTAAVASGNPAPTIAYSLLKNGSVVATTSGSYTNTAAGDILSLSVTATNGIGNPAASTAGPVTVSAAPAAPAFAVAPALAANEAGSPVTWSSGVAIGNPSPAVTYSLRKNGTQVATTSGAYSATAAGDVLTLVSTATNGAGSPATANSGPVTVTAPQMLTNRNIGTMGDSRTNQITDGSPPLGGRAANLTMNGYACWFNIANEYRTEIISNGGINTETSSDIYARFDGQGKISTNPAVATQFPNGRQFLLTNTPGGQTPVKMLLAGGNNDSADFDLTVWGTLTDNMVKKIIDNPDGSGVNRNNGFVLLCTTTPNNLNANVLQRRDYYRGYPDTSITMTAEQKTKYRPFIKVVETFRELAVNDGAQVNPNYYFPGDSLHPATAGSRVLGESMASAILPLAIASGLPKRNQRLLAADSVRPMLPDAFTAIPAGATETVGADPNSDGQGGRCVTGVMPTGWTYGRDGNLQAYCNTGTPLANGQKINITVTQVDVLGADGATTKGYQFRIVSAVGIGNASTRYNFAFFRSESTGSSMAGLVGNDEVRVIGRVQIGANPKGLCATPMSMTWRDTNETNGGQVSTLLALNNSPLLDGTAFPAFDAMVMTPAMTLTPAFIAGTTTKTCVRRFEISFIGNEPLDITVTVSDFGVAKNR